jgi:hypothetical protein
VSRVRMRVRWPVTHTGHDADYLENTFPIPFSIVACAYFRRCLEIDLHVTLLIDWFF